MKKYQCLFEVCRTRTASMALKPMDSKYP